MRDREKGLSIGEREVWGAKVIIEIVRLKGLGERVRGLDDKRYGFDVQNDSRGIFEGFYGMWVSHGEV